MRFRDPDKVLLPALLALLALAHHLHGIKFCWSAGDVILGVGDDFGQDHRRVLILRFHEAPGNHFV